jgi:hypothetical protein
MKLHGGDDFFVFSARACGECWDGLLLLPPPPPPPPPLLLLPPLFGTRVRGTCTRCKIVTNNQHQLPFSKICTHSYKIQLLPTPID